jgi:hypothetical protein
MAEDLDFTKLGMEAGKEERERERERERQSVLGLGFFEERNPRGRGAVFLKFQTRGETNGGLQGVELSNLILSSVIVISAICCRGSVFLFRKGEYQETE